MLDQEQDPSRCREIREIIRDIQNRRAAIVEQERNKRSQMTQLREEISTNVALFEEIAEAEIALGLGAIISRNLSASTGASSVGNALRISNLQSRIRNLESQVASLQHDISKIQDEMDQLLRSEGENARELSRLNCVAP